MSTYDYAARHDAEHGDRTGASTRYVEVCWKCAEDWLAYVKEHQTPLYGTVVCAIRPNGQAGGK